MRDLGRELVYRAVGIKIFFYQNIHAAGQRRKRPFGPVNPGFILKPKTFLALQENIQSRRRKPYLVAVFSHSATVYQLCRDFSNAYGYTINMEVYAENRKARFDYEILEIIEAGIELKGFEVKAVKSGKCSIAGSYAVPKGETLWLLNADVPPYQPNNTPAGYDPKRSRRLLVTREEVREFIGKTKSARLTLVPLRVYNKAGLVKVELGLARPKKKRDKRETIRKREVTKEIARTLKT